MGHAGMRKPVSASKFFLNEQDLLLFKPQCNDKEWVRLVAGNCYHARGGNTSEAIKLLNELLPDHGIARGSQHRFVKEWALKLLSGQGPYDGRRTGRPIKVDPPQAALGASRPALPATPV